MKLKHDFSPAPATAVRLMLRWRLAPESGRPVACWTVTAEPGGFGAGPAPCPSALDDLLRRHRELRAA